MLAARVRKGLWQLCYLERVPSSKGLSDCITTDQNVVVVWLTTSWQLLLVPLHLSALNTSCINYGNTVLFAYRFGWCTTDAR